MSFHVGTAPDPTPAQRRRKQWGGNLTDAIQLRQMTAKQLHQAIRDEGTDVTQQAVYLWLNGRTAPSPEHQVVITKVLAIPAPLLFPLTAAA